MAANAFGHSTDPNGPVAMMHTNHLMQAMMQTAETIRARIALMDSTVGRLLAGTPLQIRWERFKKDAIARSKERNRLSHALWVVSDEYPNDLIEYDPKTEQLFRWTEKDVLNCHKRVSGTRSETHGLLIAILEALHAGVLTEHEMGPRRVLEYSPYGGVKKLGPI